MNARPLLTRLMPSHHSLFVKRLVWTNCPTKMTHVVHDHASLCFYLGGQAMFHLGTTSYRLSAGDVLIVPPGMSHHVTEVQNVELWGLSFCPVCYAERGSGLFTKALEDVRRGACAVRQIAAEHRGWLSTLFARLEEEIAQQKAHHEIASTGLLSLLMAEILRADTHEIAKEQNPVPALVSEALHYIETHALRPISLQDVATALRRSTAYLTTTVKQHTGWTVMEWLTTHRMNEARRLLLHSDEFVDVIAERVGYTSTSHFHSLFRRTHHTTPAAWRRAHLNGESEFEHGKAS